VERSGSVAGLGLNRWVRMCAALEQYKAFNFNPAAAHIVAMEPSECRVRTHHRVFDRIPAAVADWSEPSPPPPL
jgi:hypothetical protein